MHASLVATQRAIHNGAAPSAWGAGLAQLGLTADPGSADGGTSHQPLWASLAPRAAIAICLAHKVKKRISRLSHSSPLTRLCEWPLMSKNYSHQCILQVNFSTDEVKQVPVKPVLPLQPAKLPNSISHHRFSMIFRNFTMRRTELCLAQMCSHKSLNTSEACKYTVSFKIKITPTNVHEKFIN